jgi:ABC-type antimicrobial peptide transport system permease subunit
MIQTEQYKITAMDVYRCLILGLVGIFYGFLVFLFFL